MPKVKLWADPARDLRDTTRKIIKRAMADRDLRQKDLARQVGMSESTISTKLKTGTWTQDELRRIIAVLPITLEDAAKLAGYRGEKA